MMIAIVATPRVFGSVRAPGPGYRPLYHSGAHCPGCGASTWNVGRVTAECARCSTALPIAPQVRA